MRHKHGVSDFVELKTEKKKKNMCRLVVTGELQIYKKIIN